MTTTPTTTTEAHLEQKRRWLDVLGILHYVYGALIVVPMVLGAIGIALFSGMALWEGSGLGALLPFGVFAALFVVGLIYGVVNLFAGRWLRERRNWVGALVVAAINCLNVPLGTLLGVFTIVVLAADDGQALFERRSPSPPPAQPVVPTPQQAPSP